MKYHPDTGCTLYFIKRVSNLKFQVLFFVEKFMLSFRLEVGTG